MDTEEQIVEAFSSKMFDKIQLRHNRYAPLGWMTMDVKRLVTLLKGELEELEEGLRDNNINVASSEAVDVANYAMFIWKLLTK